LTFYHPDLIPHLGLTLEDVGCYVGGLSEPYQKCVTDVQKRLIMTDILKISCQLKDSFCSLGHEKLVVVALIYHSPSVF